MVKIANYGKNQTGPNICKAPSKMHMDDTMKIDKIVFEIGGGHTWSQIS